MRPCTNPLHGEGLGTRGGSFSVALASIRKAKGGANLADNTNFHAFRWERGMMTDLGTLPGGHWTQRQRH